MQRSTSSPKWLARDARRATSDRSRCNVQQELDTSCHVLLWLVRGSFVHQLHHRLPFLDALLSFLVVPELQGTYYLTVHIHLNDGMARAVDGFGVPSAHLIA